MSLVLVIVLLGVLASVSPTTLVVFILLLASVRARANAAAFLVGWTLSLIIVFAASYSIGGEHLLRSSGGRAWIDVVEILVGLASVAVGVRQWRRRHVERSSPGVSKSLVTRVNRLNPFTAVILGILEQPWTLTAAAAIVIVRDHTAFVFALIAFVMFTVISTATVAGMYLYFARRPDKAAAHLEDLRERLVRAGPALLAIVATAVGCYLVVDGLVSLASR